MIKIQNLIIGTVVVLSLCFCKKEDRPIVTVDPTPIESYWDTLSVDLLLDTVQKATFKYFWDFAEPNSGMARERNTSGNLVTSGGSGFGVMSIIAAVDRGWITRSQGVERLNKITDFLSKCDRYHGAWSHWIDGSTGQTIAFSTKDNGGDLVETALLMQGLLAVRGYFDSENSEEQRLRGTITALWESVEWDWYTNGEDFLYWHWSPDYQWEMNHPIRGWNETMITYLLAIASPTHPIDSSLYQTGWAGTNYLSSISFSQNGANKGGPLFFTHYSFLGMNPNFKDSYIGQKGHSSYFELCKEQTLANRQHCINNKTIYSNYGKDCWGLTASDTFNGYTAHSPSNDNGTISPTAAISSIVYTPDESIAFIRHMFNNYKDKTWGIYGFKDAFNVSENWYATSYLAIDQGPIVCMIENYRSGLLWKSFMSNPEIDVMMSKIGLE